MAAVSDTKQQVQLAAVTASLFRKGHKDLAAEIVLLMLGSYNGQHVLFDDTDLDTVYMRTLHELLEDLGFHNILKTSKERAEDIHVRPLPFSPQYPGMVTPLKPWG